MLALGASIHALLFCFSVEATIARGRAKAWILAPSARMTILGDRSGAKDRDQSPIHDQPAVRFNEFGSLARWNDHSRSSCSRLARASTPCFWFFRGSDHRLWPGKGVDPRDKREDDDFG
jgi:hypothetical protein